MPTLCNEMGEKGGKGVEKGERASSPFEVECTLDTTIEAGEEEVGHLRILTEKLLRTVAEQEVELEQKDKDHAEDIRQLKQAELKDNGHVEHIRQLQQADNEPRPKFQLQHALRQRAGGCAEQKMGALAVFLLIAFA